MTDTDRRAATVKGLRDLADFLEQHPQVPPPFTDTLNAYLTSVNDIRAATHLSGKWTKSYIGEWAYYRKSFGPIGIELNISRDQVCRRVQTGVKHVEAHDEPVFEWICDEPPEADAGLVEAASELMPAGGFVMRDLSRHQCPVSVCTILLPPSKLMCLADWRRVPAALQRAVNDAYAGGTGVGTPELADAQAAAIEAVEAKLAARSQT